MRVAKHKRNFFKILPFVIFSLIVVSVFLSTFYLISAKILGKTSFISPIAQIKTYKTDSIEDILQTNNIVFSKIETATDSSKIIFLKDDGQVLLSVKKDIGSQISSLQAILSRLTIEGKKFKQLDLRFDKPIIEF